MSYVHSESERQQVMARESRKIARVALETQHGSIDDAIALLDPNNELESMAIDYLEEMKDHA